MNKGRGSSWREGAGYHPELPKLVVTAAAKGRLRSSDGRLFLAEGPTFQKALYCLLAMRDNGTRMSLLDSERRECRPEQAEVKMKSSSRYVGAMPRTQRHTKEETA